MGDKVFPSLFVSHGAPTLPLEQNAATQFLRGLGRELGKPRAILCISAHWEASTLTAGASLQPETIHDFYGFPADLYQLRYPVRGAPELAEKAVTLLQCNGLAASTNVTRGLDHGAWVPLLLMYPEADVPVAQLSLKTRAGASEHYAVGQALADLRREGVLVMGSGGAVHNLRELDWSNTAEPLGWAVAFDDWLAERITGGATDELINYRQLSPVGRRAHPTEDHFLPLFVALGAAYPAQRGAILHRSFTHGSLSMAAYTFGD